MDAARGRQQTTKGVWLGKSETDTYDLLVLDVEGTDGRERGEDQKVVLSFRQYSIISMLYLSVIRA